MFIVHCHVPAERPCILKSVNLEYDTLVRCADGTKVSSTKHLMFDFIKSCKTNSVVIVNKHWIIYALQFPSYIFPKKSSFAFGTMNGILNSLIVTTLYIRDHIYIMFAILDFFWPTHDFGPIEIVLDRNKRFELVQNVKFIHEKLFLL